MAEGAIAYEMNSEFAPLLRDRMHYFNTDPRWVGKAARGREAWSAASNQAGVAGEGGCYKRVLLSCAAMFA